ncbi:ATP-dependent helicase [Thermoproteota archaeon]
MNNYYLKQTVTNPSSLPADFDQELNLAQKEAVYFDDGPLLVIAGAGSGKTKTLVYRVARLVHSGIRPERILLLTFTRKSSQEMLRRATSILDNRCNQVAGGTFHSFANQVLRKFGSPLGLSENFTILDRSDAEDLISLIRKELGMVSSDKRFPKKNTIADLGSKSINTQREIESILAEEYPQFIDFKQEIERILTEYRVYKDTTHVMDYDDLLVKLLKLLTDHPLVREKLQNLFDYILVDEYQDTNSIQAEIVRCLANEKQNVMVVGDDSQSIYSFRGANFRNIMQFPDMFPGARVITLEQNYRSCQPILDITNALINRAREKYTKTLFTSKSGGIKPIYVEADNENMQSRFVCQRVLEMREKNIPLNKIAVLIRSGWHSNDLEVELRSQKIPFVKYGGFKFVETAHVKDVISYLRIIHNPQDTISWHRVLLLLEGIGPKGAADITRAIKQSLSTNSSVALEKYEKKVFFKEFKALIKLILGDHSSATPAQSAEAVLEYYNPLFRLKYDDFSKRGTDLESIQSIAERYETLEDFLSEMSLEPPEASQVDSLPEGKDEEKLILSTIHSAKGLEWHSVFILSVVDGFLPSFRSLGDLAQMEEERRLLYVAMTRAEENLYIIKPNLDHSPGVFHRYGGMQLSKLSRFLDEGDLINQYTERYTLVDECHHWLERL